MFVFVWGSMCWQATHYVFIPHPIYVWSLVVPSKRPCEEKQTAGARAQSGRDTNTLPILQPTTTQMVEIEPMTTQMEGEGQRHIHHMHQRKTTGKFNPNPHPPLLNFENLLALKFKLYKKAGQGVHDS